ncbi:MAG: hypothetical protein R2800_11540 [Flavipsychrobacter sp.]
MKKLLVIFISLLYLAGIVEVSFAFHYCGKNFRYVTLFKAEEKMSCCAKSEMSHGCCDNKEVKLEIDDQHHAKTIALPSKNITSALPIHYASADVQHTDAIAAVPQQGHSPPLVIPGVRLHLLHCSFLI